MGTIQRYNGSILRAGGAIAADPNCCCDGDVPCRICGGDGITSAVVDVSCPALGIAVNGMAVSVEPPGATGDYIKLSSFPLWYPRPCWPIYEHCAISSESYRLVGTATELEVTLRPWKARCSDGSNDVYYGIEVGVVVYGGLYACHGNKVIYVGKLGVDTEWNDAMPCSFGTILTTGSLCECAVTIVSIG